MVKRLLLVILFVAASGCATYSAHYASPRGVYADTIGASKDQVFSTFLKELADRNLQVGTADRQSGIVTVPNIALRQGQFDCNLLLVDDRPAYAITVVAANLQFVINGDDHAASVRATIQTGLITTVNQFGIQRVGHETCYSTHALENDVILAVKRRLGAE